MASIGFRVTRDRLFFVVVDGTRMQPQLVAKGNPQPPPMASEAESMHWFHEESRELHETHGPGYSALKGPTPNPKYPARAARLRPEGAVLAGGLAANPPCEMRLRLASQIKTELAIDRQLDQAGPAWLRANGLQAVAGTNYWEAAIVAVEGLNP